MTTPTVPAVTAPAPGDLVYDHRAERLGVVMDLVGRIVYLRPPRGGVEWTARPEHLGSPPAS
ncbi:hypothetical protein ATKI12_3117 [Kitasatospora sp. Ki12]|uniref:hypothetical protein n=1 Tax=Kitasatospora xanthocidica TaxID=83382 RepID=UPI00199683DC|nr:hypothetical protein [Kitasatospora xanthocidica]GHF57922.1 hypothetical protein GCM10018790_39650 [Kitasatospora xanthocidica]